MENKKSQYTRLLSDKVDEIIRICNENKIPVFLSFAVDGGEDKDYTLMTRSLIPELFGYKSSDTRFSDYVDVSSGEFTTVLKKKDPVEKIKAFIPPEM